MKKQFNLRHEPNVFKNKDAAIRFANRCLKLHFVMTANDTFYVVCMSDAVRLESNGFSHVK